MGKRSWRSEKRKNGSKRKIRREIEKEKRSESMMGQRLEREREMGEEGCGRSYTRIGEREKRTKTTYLLIPFE